MFSFTLSRTKQITLSGLFIAIGVILPQIFHIFGGAGPIFLPMHIPVFLAGILVGPFSGLMVAIITPTLSHFVSGMPIIAFLPFMTIELVFYGVISGLLRNKTYPLVSLIIAQLVGRLFYALTLLLLGSLLTIQVPLPRAVITALSIGLPGIIIQIVMIPLLVKVVYKGAKRHD